PALHAAYAWSSGGPPALLVDDLTHSRLRPLATFSSGSPEKGFGLHTGIDQLRARQAPLLACAEDLADTATLTLDDRGPFTGVLPGAVQGHPGGYGGGAVTLVPCPEPRARPTGRTLMSTFRRLIGTAQKALDQ